MTPESLKQARDLIGTTGITAFSFDVFDTFLLRRSTAPDGVYERAFHYAPIPSNRRMMVESFVQHRVLAEAKTRQKRWQQQATEITIDEIYAEFATHVFGLPSSARRELAAAEFRAELDLCFLNREIHALYEEARAKPLKVGFISDTYWSSPQLTELLRNVAPDLTFDFLYASCEHDFGKAGGLFNSYLRAEGLSAENAAHIGDNPVADIRAPKALGLKTVYYPQTVSSLPHVFERERGTLQLLQGLRGDVSKRLDGGLQAIRRLAAAQTADSDKPHQLVGTAVLGPVMIGFQRFVEARVAELRVSDRRVKVLFLSRDGYLPMRMWEQANAGSADYIEMNRRVTLVGCSDSVEPLQELFKVMPLVNAVAVEAVLKAKIPAVEDFFSAQPKQSSTGFAFAAELPRLIDEEEMRNLSRAMRNRLIEYLHYTVAGFDDCTDVVLVDLGYSGTIQRSLRGVFDRAGLVDKNIHGIYLAVADDGFAQLRSSDSVSGFIDDSVLTPASSRTLLRNITILDQLCSAPVGSLLSYDGPKVLREEELRSNSQLELCSEVQDSCLRFGEFYNETASKLGIDPLANVDRARVWAAAILARFLLMPRTEEQEAFGRLIHDVNLGSRALINMVDTPSMDSLMGTMSFAEVCAVRDPPMWLAGSIASVSPMAGYAYALAGFGVIGTDALADSFIGQLDVTLIKDDVSKTVPVHCLLTAFGDVRVRIPVLQKHTGSVIAVPLERFLHSGVIESLTLQQGANSHQALHSRQIERLPMSAVRGLRAHHNGHHFRATEADGHLLLTIPPSDQPLSIVTMTVGPLPPVAA